MNISALNEDKSTKLSVTDTFVCVNSDAKKLPPIFQIRLIKNEIIITLRASPNRLVSKTCCEFSRISEPRTASRCFELSQKTTKTFSLVCLLTKGRVN